MPVFHFSDKPVHGAADYHECHLFDSSGNEVKARRIKCQKSHDWDKDECKTHWRNFQVSLDEGTYWLIAAFASISGCNLTRVRVKDEHIEVDDRYVSSIGSYELRIALDKKFDVTPNELGFAPDHGLRRKLILNPKVPRAIVQRLCNYFGIKSKIPEAHAAP